MTEAMTEDVPPNHTIYLKNPNDKIKQDRMKAAIYSSFSQHGKILEIVMGKARKLRGQAWVTFDDIPSASNALRAMNGFVLFEKPVVIQFGKDKADVIARREGTFKPREKRKREQPEEKATKKAAENGAGRNGAPARVPPPPPPPMQNLPNKILFIQELPDSCTKDMLSTLFEQYHGFKEVRMVGTKGLAFVEYGDEAQAAIALQALHGFKLTPTELLKVSQRTTPTALTSVTMATTTTTTAAPALEARALQVAENTPEMQAEHARITQGKVRTRFPPEPNGYLHIGHAKSMNMNFQEAFGKLGVPEDKRETYLRYDDTNPEAESKEYIDSILSTVQWLGYTPTKITYSSEYFAELHALAIKLIKKGKAFVCHQTKAEIEQSRTALQQFHSTPGAKKEEDVPQAALSPFRSRSVEENLVEFEKMRMGLYAEGAACLRMKMDLTSPNPNMWDHVAYRIKYVPHPHVGDAWCIYPTYDYTHCIVDALEHIDYSICTLEFETRRESYYWLLDVLDLYKPKVYEFARLDMTYTVLSKRKLLKLVTSGTVRGWDDPRMGTLYGLQRRGFSPAIINQFCKEIGVTRVQSTIQIERLYAVARAVYGDASKRVMAVLDPVEVVLENFDTVPNKDMLRVTVPDFPQDPERDNKAEHHVTLTKTVYLDRSDVRLKYGYNVTATKIEKDAKTGQITRVYGTVDWTNEVKPKGFLTWVPANSPQVEVRVYSHLFKTPELPSGVTDWESYVDTKTSETVYRQARIDPESYAKNLPAVDAGSVQFERMGYFVLDKDSTNKRKVLNQVVPLREASSLAGQDEDKAKTNESRKDAQAQQLALKLEKMKISPQDLFKSQTDLYSQFDAEGLPTHDAAGVALTKNQVKKLKKEQDKQKKLYESKTSSLHRTASEPAMKEKKPANCHPITRKAVSTEHTPLVLKKQEEVHPLPWFRSPEWSKRSPQASGHAHKKSHTSHHRRKRPHTNRYGKSHSWVSIFCCCGPSDDYDDMEAGVRSRMLARTATDDANAEAHGFRQCIQFLPIERGNNTAQRKQRLPLAASATDTHTHMSFSFGSTAVAPSTGGTGFSFGASTPATTAPSSSSTGFSFGSTPAATAPTTAPSSGFSFGATPAAGSTAAAPPAAASTGGSGFSFGATPSVSTGGTSTGFSFGATPSVSTAGSGSGFSFGGTSTAATTAPSLFGSSGAATSTTPSFGFGGTSTASTGGGLFGNTSATKPGGLFGSTTTGATTGATSSFGLFGAAGAAGGAAQPAGPAITLETVFEELPVDIKKNVTEFHKFLKEEDQSDAFLKTVSSRKLEALKENMGQLDQDVLVGRNIQTRQATAVHHLRKDVKHLIRQVDSASLNLRSMDGNSASHHLSSIARHVEMPSAYYWELLEHFEAKMKRLKAQIQEVEGELKPLYERPHSSSANTGAPMLQQILVAQNAALMQVAAHVAEVHEQAEQMRQVFLNKMRKDWQKHGEQSPGAFKNPFDKSKKHAQAEEDKRQMIDSIRFRTSVAPTILASGAAAAPALTTSAPGASSTGGFGSLGSTTATTPSLFGATSTGTSTSTTGGGLFGSSTTTPGATSTGFSFGGTTNTAATGVSTAKQVSFNLSTPSPAAPASTSGFSFGATTPATPAPATAPTFGAPAATPAFGATAAPAFGASSSTPAFGGVASPFLGASSTKSTSGSKRANTRNKKR
ncbi:TPA: hypothetical protein N0F65_012509 [Lagenidium giganteum]|uniref:glutamine--tRNA ligase n=1 Tax=Lagenidium giganteum TaxID=4803 RepID=A0AAV2YF61_9STRA|nr:TPA: hypothetical protein N0F65_012509 [Lagenidium giganteum]